MNEPKKRALGKGLSALLPEGSAINRASVAEMVREAYSVRTPVEKRPVVDKRVAIQKGGEIIPPTNRFNEEPEEKRLIWGSVAAVGVGVLVGIIVLAAPAMTQQVTLF
jgi:hypothetical protein